MCRRREERFQSCQTSGRDYKAPRCIYMRLVMEMWYACMFVCVNVWWYKHIYYCMYLYLYIHWYIYICIFFMYIHRYHVLFDMFWFWPILHLLERHCLGYDFQISVCKILGSPSNKSFPSKQKKTSEATDLQETQLGARSLKSPEGCFLKCWYPQHTPKMIIFSRKTHVLGNPQKSAENLQTCFWVPFTTSPCQATARDFFTRSFTKAMNLHE